MKRVMVASVVLAMLGGVSVEGSNRRPVRRNYTDDFAVWRARAYIMDQQEGTGQLVFLLHDEPCVNEADATAKAQSWCANGITLPQTEDYNFEGIRIFPARQIAKCDTYVAY